MRTTITIDEELLSELKERAAREGTTVSRLIEDSARLAARRHAVGDAGQPFNLVTLGRVAVSPASTLIGFCLDRDGR